MNHQPQLAFLGLGRMGIEMVRALTEHGHRPTVWNRSSEKATALAAELQLDTGATPADAARGADIVFLMLTDGPAVLATLDAANGVLSTLRAGSVVIDCSTTGAAAAREAARRCAEVGVHFLDCPVSGSTMVARQGRLGLMVGGEAAVLNTVRPQLDALGTIVHVGPNGAGAAAKVAVNALLHTFSVATGECIVTARAAGVAPDQLFEVLAAGALWNRFLDYKRAAFIDPDAIAVAFDLRTATKDLDLAVQAEQEAGLSETVVSRACELHHQALLDGYGDKDIAAVGEWFAAKAAHHGQ